MKGGLVRCVSTWILFHNEWWDCIIYLWWLSRRLWIRKLETYEVLTLRRKTCSEGTLLVTVSQKNKPENDWGIFCKYNLHLTKLPNRIFSRVHYACTIISWLETQLLQQNNYVSKMIITITLQSRNKKRSVLNCVPTPLVSPQRIQINFFF